MNVFQINSNDNKIGGASRIAIDIHENLLNFGHSSFIAIGKNNYLNSNCYEIPRNLYHKSKAFLFSSDIDFFQSDKILKLEAYKKSDIVHCHNLHGWYFKLDTLKKISEEKPIIWTLHDMWAINPISGHTTSCEIVNNLYTVSDRNLYPKTLWNNDSYLSRKKNKIYNSIKINIVSPSIWLSNKIMKTSLGKQCIYQINNGIDTNIFKPSSNFTSESEFPFLENKNTIIYIGAFAKTNIYKGFNDFEWLIQNLSPIDYQFICIGASESYKKNNVYFIKQTHDKHFISSLISRADLLVLTSSHENSPLVVMEALACNTPVISYDTGGVSEILGDLPNCKLVPKSDKISFLKAVNDYFTNRKNLTENKNILRKKIINKYSLEVMMKNYISLYQQILNKYPK